MAQITDIYKFTEYWKKRYPQVYQGKSDREIVDLVRERYPDIGLPSYEEALQTNESVYAEEEPKKYSDESLMSKKTDPKWVDSWFLTSDFVPEKWQQEGALGGLISADFFKKSYNESMAGMLYRTAHGEDKWDVSEEYDPAWYAQAGQFAVGMASPLDAATMVLTGGLGGASRIAGKFLVPKLFASNIGKKYIEKGLLANYGLRNKTIGNVAARTIDGALSLGVGGGTFAASHAMLNETARQRKENPDKPVNISKALQVASNDLLHTLPMFAISGGVTQGIMGSIYGYSTAFAGKSPTYAQKLTQAATSPLSRVGTEATLFTSLPSVLGDEEAPKLGSNEWWGALGTNALVVGGMRAVGKFTEPMLVTSEGKKVPIEAFDVINSEIKLSSKIDAKTNKSLKEVAENTGTATPKNIRDIIAQYERNTTETKKSVSQIKKDYKFMREFNNRIDTEPKFLEKVAIKGTTENIQASQYMKLINDHSTFANGIKESVLTQEGRASEIYKDIIGREPNPTELKSFEKALENTRDSVVDNQKAVDDYLTGNWLQSKDGINGGETTLKPPDKPIVKTKQAEIDKYVDLIAGEKGVLPSEVIKEPKYKKGILIKGESELSLRKLKEAYRAEIEKRPGTPSTELTKVLTDLDIAKSSELPVFSKKIKGTKPIKDYISELKLDKTNEKMLYQGISEFMQTRKSSNNPSNYKIIADYAKWLESKGRNLSEANRSLTDLYVNEQNALGKLTTKNQRSQLNNSLSAFYGTGGVGKQPLDTGFAYKYMGTKEKTPAVSQLGVDRAGTIATQERIALVEPKDYGLIRAKNKELIEIGEPLQGRSKQKVDPLTYDVATELLYNFGARGKDSLSRLFIENIDVKNGIIREWSTGAGQKGAAGPRLDIPVGKMLPELWKNIVKVIGDRKSGNLLKGLDGKNLLGDSVNIINQAIMPKGVNLRGKKGKLTIGDYRKMAMTDAFNIGGDKLREFVKLNLIGHKAGLTQRYTIQEFQSNWKKFIDGRKALDKTKAAPVKEIIIADVKGTKAQQIKYHENIVASIKRDLKTAKSAGERENLQSQLRGASMQLFGVKKIKEKRAKRLPEEEVFQSKGDKAIRDKFVAKVMKKNKLTKEQLRREGLDEGVLGEFGEGIIKLDKGMWQPADFYHENLHRLKAFARLSNNKSLEKLIARGEKLAVNTKEYKAWKKNNVNRDVEEFLADIAGGKASRIEFTKGMLPKISQFIKQLVSRVKVALGTGNFKDISNVLAKRVQKGFSTEGVEFARGQVKFKLEGKTDAQAIKYVRKRLNEIFSDKKLERGIQSKIEEHIGGIAQLGEKFKLSKADPFQVEQFLSTVEAMVAGGKKAILKRMPDKLGWLEATKKAEQIRLDKNVTESVMKNMLEDLGVVDGNRYKASAKQLRDFIEVLNTMDDVKTSSVAWIEQRVAKGLVNREIADKFLSLRGARAVLPVSTVLEYVGLKDIAQKLYNHNSSKLEYTGEITTYENKMTSLFGNKTWDKVKDFTFLFDKERYFERLEKGYLSNAQKKFMNKAFDINVDKKSMKVKKGKEGTLVKEHRKLMKYYKDSFIGEDGVLRQVLNDAQYEKYINDKNINWVNEANNIYVHRRLTKEAKKYLDPDAGHYEKVLKKQADAISEKLAKRYFKEKDKNYTKEQFEKKKDQLYDDAIDIARGEISDLNAGYIPNKYTPNFYKERHIKLPEKFKADGKLVETYERSYQSTTKDYALGQAQFLANIEYFPEFVRVKGFNIPGTGDMVSKLKSSYATRDIANFLDGALKDHLGIGKRKLSEYPGGVRFLSNTASFMAKMQLSLPTSGLKNFLVGSTQSLLAFRTKDFLLSFKDAIHADNRAYVKATGATEIGMRSFDIKGVAGKFDKAVEKAFFRWGGMKRTENLNRYTSVLAGKRDQLGLSRTLKYSKEGSRKYNNAVNKLKSFYKLSDGEIALLKKFGMKGIEGLDAKTASLYKRKLDKLYQKMSTFAHINTQGAAINLFMPDWTRSQVAQASLLYKRMAYAATVNTTRSLKIALQNKSMFQIAAFGLGTYYSGEALLWVYSNFFGQTMPKENSSEFQRLRTTLWKGEFLGILSDLLSPYDKRSVFDSMYPSILSTASVMGASVMSVIKGERFKGQGFEDFMRGSNGLYNGITKIYKQGLGAKDSYVSQSKRYRKLYIDMAKEKNDKKAIVGQNTVDIEFRTSKYMRAFRELFESGRGKDLSGNSVGKWYMMCLFAKANDYYYTKITEDGRAVKSHKDAMKYATESMESVLRNLNPNKVAITAETKKGQIEQARKTYLFHDWLDRDFKAGKSKEKLSKGLKKLETQYKYRKRIMAKSASEYIKSGNLEKDLKYYDISIRDILK